MPAERAWCDEVRARRRAWRGRAYQEIMADMEPLSRKLLWEEPLDEEEMARWEALNAEADAHPETLETEEQIRAELHEKLRPLGW